jgi:hypothetical protein
MEPSVSGLPIAGDPKNDGHLSPWQEAVGTWGAQQFRACGLNLVIAAIVFRNSTEIADAIAQLRG